MTALKSLEQLKDQSEVNELPSDYTLKIWLESARKVYVQAEEWEKLSREEEAFIFWRRWIG